MDKTNVERQSFFSKPITAMDSYNPKQFGQENEAYAVSTMMRNSALEKIKQLREANKPQEPQDLSMEGNGFTGMLKDFIGSAGQTVGDVAGQAIDGGQAIGRAVQKGILGAKGVVTQGFGNRSSVEKYSGGVNYGTDFAVPRGTPVAAPEGDWVVVEAFNKATKEGPNNAQGGINRGYGNSVLIQNQKTGEKLRYSHLRVGGVRVQPGQEIPGGTVFGETGASGNTAGRTGQHLDLEYYDRNGRIRDVYSSQYGRYL